MDAHGQSGYQSGSIRSRFHHIFSKTRKLFCIFGKFKNKTLATGEEISYNTLDFAQNNGRNATNCTHERK